MPDTSVLNAIAKLWSIRPQLAPTKVLSDQLRAMGLWRPCRVLGSRCNFRLVFRRGRRSVHRNIEVHCTRCDATVVSVVSGLCISCSVYSSLRRSCSQLIYSCLNIRSLANKLNDVLEFVRDNKVDVMCLIESWHDTDDVSSSVHVR